MKNPSECNELVCLVWAWSVGVTSYTGSLGLSEPQPTCGVQFDGTTNLTYARTTRRLDTVALEVMILFKALPHWRSHSITDSCKFLHDRGDYKSGWQLDREFEESGFEREGRAIM